MRWLRANLFSGPVSTAVSLGALYLIGRGLWALVDWGLIDAVWRAPDGRACTAASGGNGACWAFIGEWARFILFGRYPYAEQGRPLAVVLVFAALLAASCVPRLWGPKLALLWALGLVLNFVLMLGGAFGLAYVPTELWNGLPLTLILAIV